MPMIYQERILQVAVNVLVGIIVLSACSASTQDKGVCTANSKGVVELDEIIPVSTSNLYISADPVRSVLNMRS